jgi:protein TonB
MSSSIAMASRRDDKTLLVLAIGLIASVAIHAGGLTYASLHPAAVKVIDKPIEMQIVVTEPPKPPPPPEPEPPKPVEPPKPKIKPPEIKVAKVDPPPVKEPPPPIEEVKEPPKPVPLVVGISMSSTTQGGNFAAPVGNTAYGKVADKAVAPSSVQNYAAPKYVPPGSADRDPEVANEFKIPYPDEARRAGIEGTVRLRIVVDNEGRVVDVQILNGPGYGLNEAAKEAIKKFKFRAAIKGGEAVSTTMVYNYTFLLD